MPQALKGARHGLVTTSKRVSGERRGQRTAWLDLTRPLPGHWCACWRPGQGCVAPDAGTRTGGQFCRVGGPVQADRSLWFGARVNAAVTLGNRGDDPHTFAERQSKPLSISEGRGTTLAERGLNVHDKRLVQLIQKRVGAALKHWRARGVLEAAKGPGAFLMWSIAQATDRAPAPSQGR